MDKKDLIKFCRYYHGEKECPYRKEQSKNIWALENFWVNRYDSIRELLSKNLDEYLKAGLSTFNQTDDTPIMLKAFLFSRFCSELVDVDNFKDWYNNVYYGK